MRRAVENLLQGILDDPSNASWRLQHDPTDATPGVLWREGLVLVYRLLFILKLESSPDPAGCFGFVVADPWRRCFSPSVALAPIVRARLDHGADTDGVLAGSLRALFRMFAVGVQCGEMVVRPLGGLIFGPAGTPTLDALHWNERAVAELLDTLLWTPAGCKAEAGREQVDYGALEVEDFGRVYEALLELEPGISREPMCRLRRARLEVVVPRVQGEPYRKGEARTRVDFIEDIPADRFFLRVGLGRKASGSYYTPQVLVRFLVEQTLGPLVRERSPPGDPQPLAILGLKVLDPAMGSGHFLVEACRYLGDALHGACRLCDERATALLEQAQAARTGTERSRLDAEARTWRARVEALPGPNDELLAHLPGRAPGAHERGASERRALAICRRLVALHCLHGVDRNPLAVELARVSLWFESHAGASPLTFLDHRLIQGDSLTGPCFEDLLRLPGSGECIDDRLAQRLSGALTATLADARPSNSGLDEALAPFRLLAQAWAGGVMLGKDGGDDDGYRVLAEAVASQAPILSPPVAMIQAGAHGIAYDLQFPDVFHPDGAAKRTGGFHAVLGNPPWDRLLPADKEFFAGLDLRILEAPTKKEREGVARALQKDPRVRASYHAYLREFRSAEAVIRRTYRFQEVEIDGEKTIGKPDAYRLFIERSHQLAAPMGRMGLLVPSGFHANEGATGVRRLLLDHAHLEQCYSFENSAGLFDIHRSFKFAAIVAVKDSDGTKRVRCAFHRRGLDWLAQRDGTLIYERWFIAATGGAHLTFLELRTAADHAVATQTFTAGAPFARSAAARSVRIGRELNMTDDAYRFTSAPRLLAGDARCPETAARLRKKGYLPLHEGKTFHQYDDRWGDPPRYLIALAAVRDKPAWTGPARFFRAAFRDIASATNERTGIFCLLPPGVLLGNTAPVEKEPGGRPVADALTLIAIGNAFVFDWHIRQKAASHVNLFILNGCPVPRLDAARERFLAHAALRLSCNHIGYAPLWTEQLGTLWRESTDRHTWPVLAADSDREAVRAAIDAVLADAYGLSREQFAHVLASFTHKSRPAAPGRCLAVFDELRVDGLDATLRRHDPYHDVPLVTRVPVPALDLPA